MICENCRKRSATIAHKSAFGMVVIYLCVICFRDLFNAQAPKEELQKVISDSKTPTDLINKLAEWNNR